jgi:hypothetical protein
MAMPPKVMEKKAVQVIKVATSLLMANPGRLEERRVVRIVGDDITYHFILHPRTRGRNRAGAHFGIGAVPQSRAGWGFPAVLTAFARRSIETSQRALTPSHSSPIIRPRREQLIAHRAFAHCASE